MGKMHVSDRFHAKCFLVFYSFACIFHYGTPSKCNLVFDNHPNSLAVYEGQDASFTCTASNFNNATDTLIWKVNPSQYYSVISEFYDPLTLRMTSNLTVFNVQRTSQIQQCVAFILGSNYMTKTCYSDIANLNVYYFPREDELLCEPQHPGVLVEGQILKIWCQVPKGNPEINFTWELEGGINTTLTTLVPSHISGSFKVLDQYLEIERSLHNQSIVCKVTSPAAFPGHRLSLLIGPFLIHHKPHLTLNPSRLVLDESYHQLICKGSAFPIITNISWSCLPSDRVQGCDLIHDQNHILNITISQNNTCLQHGENCSVTIACSATNPVGTSIVETNVWIFPHITMEKQHVESDFHMDLNIVNASSVGLGEWEAYLTCIINSTFSLEVRPRVRCIFNNRSIPIHEDDDGHMKYRRKYILKIGSMELNDSGKRVVCLLISREGEVITEVGQNISELFVIAQNKSIEDRVMITKSKLDSFIHFMEKTESNENKYNITSSNEQGTDSRIFQKSSGRKYIIVIATSAGGGGLILAGCIFAVITMILYQHFRQISSAMCSKDQTMGKESIQLKKKHQTVGETLPAAEEEHVYQDLIEIMHEHRAKQTWTYRDSVSSSSNESNESDMSYCSISGHSHNSAANLNEYLYGSYTSDKSDISAKIQGNSLQSTPNENYANQSIIKKQSGKPTSFKKHRANLEDIIFTEPPPLPL